MEATTLSKAMEVLEAAERNKGTYASSNGALIEGRGSIAQAMSCATQRAIEAAARAGEIAGTVDERARANPWAFVGGAAFVGILLGYIIGKTK